MVGKAPQYFFVKRWFTYASTLTWVSLFNLKTIHICDEFNPHGKYLQL